MTLFAENGGYHKINRKLYNVSYARHSMTPSQGALDALHLIQETPWEINKDVMLFIDYLQTQGKSGPMGLSGGGSHFVRLSKEEWESLSNKQRREIFEAKQRGVSERGKSSAIDSRIQIANELRDKEEFYQPQFFCFRGRIYPMNTEFNNQADHFSKGMMRFKNGMPLGPKGLRELKLHIANTWGQDKLQLEDRELYVNDRIDTIHSIASSFEVAAVECSKADEPIAFYAAVLELSSALRSGDPESFVSHVPGAIDGTCNGLQILSLLGHDHVGAEKTNCTSNPKRQDVYMEVADIAETLVEADKMSDSEIDLESLDGAKVGVKVSDLACIWYEHLQDPNARRKAVKRAIMTTAYGVTAFSMGRNLIADGIVDKLGIPEEVLDIFAESKYKGLLAAYFRDKIVEARRGAINHAVEIMDYFTGVARALAENGLDMAWTVPDGLRVTQSYREITKKRYKSVDLGELTINKVTDIRHVKKQGSGAAPQVVHSLDAAMLRMTCIEMAKLGYTDLCMIHDSYGTHFGAIHDLHRVLREVAVFMFGGNWLLDSFHQEQLKHGVDLPTPPSQGTLDVSYEIPKAQYFFS